jgi:hypothetical protein
MKKFFVIMVFCTAIFAAANVMAAAPESKKYSIDLNRGTVQGAYTYGDVRTAGTIHAPRPVKRRMTQYQRNRKFYSTPRGRYMAARSFSSRIASSYGNLNQ